METPAGQWCRCHPRLILRVLILPSAPFRRDFMLSPLFSPKHHALKYLSNMPQWAVRQCLLLEMWGNSYQLVPVWHCNPQDHILLRLSRDSVKNRKNTDLIIPRIRQVISPNGWSSVSYPCDCACSPCLARVLVRFEWRVRVFNVISGPQIFPFHYLTSVRIWRWLLIFFLWVFRDRGSPFSVQLHISASLSINRSNNSASLNRLLG